MVGTERQVKLGRLATKFVSTAKLLPLPLTEDQEENRVNISQEQLNRVYLQKRHEDHLHRRTKLGFKATMWKTIAPIGKSQR